MTPRARQDRTGQPRVAASDPVRDRTGQVWEHLILEPTEGCPSDVWLVTASERKAGCRWRHSLLNLETGERDAALEWDHSPWPDREGARRIA
jgi:hypothetical protein